MNEYDQDFFDNHIAGSSRSASILVPIVNDIVYPRSVVDIGSGIGAWLEAWNENGVSDLLGIDGEYVDRSKLLTGKDQFMAHDLTKPLKLDRKFDLAMSLEVAEHLDEEIADTFVQSIVGLSDVVFFSAAIPGQGGLHHVNEQWPSYWSKKFARHGYHCFDVLRSIVWNMEDVEFWYRQNCMIFATEEASSRLSLVSNKTPLDIAHPSLLLKFTS